MERFAQYLDIVDPWLLMLPALVVTVLVVMVPHRARLSITLAGLVVVMGLGSLPQLGAIAAAAKVATPGAFLIVILASLLGCRARIYVSLMGITYLGVAALSFAFIVGVADFAFGVVTLTNWFLLVLSAVGIISNSASEEDWLQVMRGLAWGLGIVACIMIAALLTDGSRAFGNGRFMPYGSDPNRSGLFGVLALATGLYLAVRDRVARFAPVYLLFACAGLGIVAVSGQRQVALAASLVLLPFVVHMRIARWPVKVAAAVLVFVAAWFVGRGIDAGANIERLTSLQSSRYERVGQYMESEILERPIFGLLGKRATSFLKGEEMGGTHNAYIYILYLGGLSLFLPMMLCVMITLWAAISVLTRPKRVGWDPLLISVLFALIVAIYLQGMANNLIYWGTHPWPLFHVVLSLLFFRLWRRGGSLERDLNRRRFMTAVHAPSPRLMHGDSR